MTMMMKMKSKKYSTTLLLLISLSFSFATQSFTSTFISIVHQRQSQLHQQQHHQHLNLRPLERNRNNILILSIRGGALVNNSDNSSMMSSSTSLSLSTAASILSHSLASSSSLLRQALISGTPLHALGALYFVCALTVVPLTWISTAYSFSVGYGLSIATMALALLSCFPTTTTTTIPTQLIVLMSPSHMATLTALLYGLRLAIFIYVREHTVESKRRQFQTLNKTPPIKRTPLALGVSVLYVCMISPLLFALRAGSSSDSGVSTISSSGSISRKIQWVSTTVAIFGMLLESIADQHKYQIKRRHEQKNKGEETPKNMFVGPTTWTYKLCRHPNYLGEILHWIGLFGVGSVSSFGTFSPVAWISGVLGLYGILNIMFGASKRLDTKQTEMYSGQSVFEEWKTKVTWSLIPFVK